MQQEQYEIILSALTDKIKSQEQKINIQKWKIEGLEKALADANQKNAGAKPPALEIR